MNASQRWTATALLALASAAVHSQARVQREAPLVAGVDVEGRTLHLSHYRGRHVVLEWVNPLCPFVGKHYGSGNMQQLQKDATAKGVVWLSIASAAASSAEYRTPAQLKSWMQQRQAAPTAIIADSDGRIGKAFGAKSTPHLFIVDPDGRLIYAGGIDDKPGTDTADLRGATNFVRLALDEALAGKPVSRPITRPYGCGIPYAPG